MTNINNCIAENDLESRKYNCIELNIAGVKINNPSKPVLINLDTGNQLPYPVISGEYYEQLKALKLIPSTTVLKPSKYTVEAADQSPIIVRGTIKHPLKFFNQEIKFVFSTFLIIDNLNTNINFGKGILDKLKINWEFGKPSITILGNNIKLCEQTNPTQGNLIMINKIDSSKHATKLYPKSNMYLEPNTVTFIPLKFRQKQEYHFKRTQRYYLKEIATWRKENLYIWTMQISPP